MFAATFPFSCLECSGSAVFSSHDFAIAEVDQTAKARSDVLLNNWHSACFLVSHSYHRYWFAIGLTVHDLLTRIQAAMSRFSLSNFLRVALKVSLAPLASVALMCCIGCSDSATKSDADSSNVSAPAEAAKSEPAKTDTPETNVVEDATAETSKPAASELTTTVATTSKPAASKPVDPSAIGSFSGKIVLDGEAPSLAPLTKADDEGLKDKEVCGAGDVPDESLLVGEGNGIANVFVYLRRAPKGFKSDPPAEAVVLDQKGCIFTPHVALIQAGQKVLVKSSDAVQHNVHTFPSRNQGTNLLINPNDQVGIELTYAKAESDPLQVKCDIHSWMSSYHLVLDHPFMAVTDSNGQFSIDGLPAGEYEFRVWHEKAGLLEKGYTATVSGEDDAVELKYAVDKFAG